MLSTIGIALLIGPDGEVSGMSMYPVGALIFSGGLVSLAVGSLKGHRLPRWAPILWVLSTAVGFVGFFIPALELLFVASGVLFGISFAGAGMRVWSAASEHQQ